MNAAGILHPARMGVNADSKTRCVPIGLKRFSFYCKRFAQSARPGEESVVFQDFLNFWGPSGSLFGVLFSFSGTLGALWIYFEG